MSGTVPGSVTTSLSHHQWMRQWQPSLEDPNVRVEGRAELEQALRIVLTTPVGSVAGRPAFGSRLHELVDAPIATVRRLAPGMVMRAVAIWEPRIEIAEAIVVESLRDEHIVLQVSWHPVGAPGFVTTSEVSVG